MNKRLYPIYFSIALLVIFTFIYIIQGNYEFLAYIITLGILVWIIAVTDKRFRFLFVARWGFAIWMLMHMLGGSLFIKGQKLYELILIDIVGEPYNILKYDQFVHFYCYLVLTLFVYSLVLYFSNRRKLTKTSMLILVLASIGIGAINEMIEFGTVVFLNSSGVGDYTNNALDLVFNFIGSIFALIYLKMKE